MELSERTKVDKTTLDLTKQFFKNIGIDFRFFIDPDGSTEEVILFANGSTFYYKTYKELFEDVKPIIRALECKQAELEMHDRKMRWFLQDAMEQLQQQFNVSSYTISLAKHEVNKNG